jgi:hypothetical protein
MTPVLAYYGNSNQTEGVEFVSNDNTMLASSGGFQSSGVWITGGWVYGRRDAASATATAHVGVYTTDSNQRPQAKLGTSTDISFGSSVMSLKQFFFTTPVGLGSGRFASGIIGTNVGTTFLVGAGPSNSGVSNIYKQTGLSSGNLPTPFTGAYLTGQNSLTLYLYGNRNEAPRTPIITSPSGTVNTTTPTFVSTFRDWNGTFGTTSGDGQDVGDKLSKYHIVVRNASTLQVVWDAMLTATSSERTADATAAVYAGTALTRGTTYEWMVTHFDDLGGVSPDTEWVQFTPANVGFITLDGAPTGHLDVNTGITFNARWNHDGGLAMNAAEIRLRGSIGGSILQASPTIVKSVASSASPGTNFTMTWAETTFANLDWSKDYYYEVRGRDTSSNWSTWSDPRLFTTDLAPGVPTNLTPSSGDVWTSYPLIRFSFTDGDDVEPPAGTLSGISRLTDSTGYAQDVTAAWNSSIGLWEATLTDTQMKRNEVQTIKINSTTAPTGGTFTLTFNGSTTAGIAYNANAATVQTALTGLASVGAGNATVTGGPGPNAAFVVTFINTRGLTDQPAITATLTGLTGGSGHTFSNTETTKGGIWYGTYSHKATGFDGTLYSGGVTTLASATWSPSATFQYQAGPIPTITAPTNGSTSVYSSIVMTWTVSAGTQAKYQVEAMDTSGVKVYDSGVVISGALTHTIPSGWLRNLQQYSLVLTVFDSLDLPGVATALVTINLGTTTAPTGFQAIPVSLKNDPFPTAIQLFWDPTTIAEKYFRHYSIWRTGGGETRRIMFVKTPAITSFIDHNPVSGVDYTYKLRQVLKEPTSGVAENEVESAEVTANARVDLNGMVLASVENGEDHRVVLHFADDRGWTRMIEEATFTPLAGRKSPITGGRETPKPVTYRSRARWFEGSGTYQLVTDRYATAQDRWEDLNDLDATRAVCSVRTERGDRWFVRITDLQRQDVRPMRYTISMSLREEDYTEGVI